MVIGMTGINRPLALTVFGKRVALRKWRGAGKGLVDKIQPLKAVALAPEITRLESRRVRELALDIQLVLLDVRRLTVVLIL